MTLVTISLLFIICQSVKIIADVYELFCVKEERSDGKMTCDSNAFIETAISLSNLSTCVNSSANFLVYMLRGKKFRDLFLETYCCKNPSSTSGTGGAASAAGSGVAVPGGGGGGGASTVCGLAGGSTSTAITSSAAGTLSMSSGGNTSRRESLSRTVIYSIRRKDLTMGSFGGSGEAVGGRRGGRCGGFGVGSGGGGGVKAGVEGGDGGGSGGRRRGGDGSGSRGRVQSGGSEGGGGARGCNAGGGADCIDAAEMLTHVPSPKTEELQQPKKRPQHQRTFLDFWHWRKRRPPITGSCV